MNALHVPVLRNELIEALRIQPGKHYIDATTGGGGHTEEIIRRGGRVLGIDRDGEILEYTRKRLREADLNKTEHGDWVLVQGNFADIEELAIQNGFEHVDGILFDLGVSSFQLDTPGRGFSFRFTDAPLDVRMDQARGDTAAQLVNRLSEEELYDIFSTFGEEQHSRSVARAICLSRAIKPIRTVGDLAGIIRQVVPGGPNETGALARIFQAVRIAVNEELVSLKTGLSGAERLLSQGGILAVISFHSLEDRIVKQFIRNGPWTAVTKHPVRPTVEEMESNKRSRSAKLRVAIKN